jgi:HK97 family phage portal protein
MSFTTRLQSIFRRKGVAPRPFEDVIAMLDQGNSSAFGPVISARTALQVSTVLACTRIIADGCATPPLHVYRWQKDKPRELARNIPEYRMLNRRPNEWHTSYEFRRMMTAHAVLTGGALALKVKGTNGRVRELIPVLPENYIIEHNARYDLQFRVWDKFGHIGVFNHDEVFYLPGLQWEFLKGLEAVKLARSAIGLAMAAESAQIKLFENGGRPAGILMNEKAQSKAVIETIRQYWREIASQRGTAILDNGFTYQQLAMTSIDAQQLETRRFEVEEICRFMGVSPVVIGHSEKMPTLPGAVEGYFGTHQRQALEPWHELWRQRVDEFVLDGDGPLYVEFDTRYMSRGSIKDRQAFIRTVTELGIYTRNEIRDDEGKDPLPGLDEPLTPVNLGTGSEPDADETDEQQDPNP